MGNQEKSYYCEKCHRTLNGSQFYVSNNLEKYPNDGKLNMCKKCLTMHVDNWNPDTYLWILQECDVPYIPDQWNKLMYKYAKEPEKVTGTTILGRYLAKMRLKPNNIYRWKDTQFLQEMADAELERVMRRQGYETEQIVAAKESKKIEIPEEGFQIPQYEDTLSCPNFKEEEEEDNLDLTEEDKIYLRLKWGKNYKPEEWVKLEQLFQEMMESYDIQTAGHIDTLKLICKTSLKANQLIDINDVEGFQKMSKVYDQLMKSGKFDYWTMKNFAGYHQGHNNG